MVRETLVRLEETNAIRNVANWCRKFAGLRRKSINSHHVLNGRRDAAIR
jgi:hypothetical protein